jgi:ketosteroid isomerase-like protein
MEMELQRISDLHERDAEASRDDDFATLRSLVSEDAVLMPPGQDWVRGSEALDENYARMAEAMRDVEVTEYSLDFQEVLILGDYAFEWGTIRGAMRPRGSEPSTPPEPSSYKVLRVLKKDPDGHWRVHRAMWNASPPEPGSAA